MRTPSLYVVLLLLPLSTLITAVPAPEGVIDDDPKVDTILTVYRYEGFGEQKLDTADKGDSFYYVYITGKADNEHNFDGPQNKYRKPNTCFRLDKLGEAMKPVDGTKASGLKGYKTRETCCVLYSKPRKEFNEGENKGGDCDPQKAEIFIRDQKGYNKKQDKAYDGEKIWSAMCVQYTDKGKKNWVRQCRILYDHLPAESQRTLGVTGS